MKRRSKKKEEDIILKAEDAEATYARDLSDVAAMEHAKMVNFAVADDEKGWQISFEAGVS